MPSAIVYNHIRYLVNGKSIELQLDGEFTLSAGFEHNVNSFTVSMLEFNKLSLAPVGPLSNDSNGTLAFYSSADSISAGTPDYSLANVTLLDVEGTKWGNPAPGASTKIKSSAWDRGMPGVAFRDSAF